MARPKAYNGNESYVFISYSHRDENRVWPIIEGLQRRGVRVWYDGGIEPGRHWDEEIFRHLDGSSHILAFVTENFLRSENCMDEIHFAKENKKGPMMLYLDSLELPRMLQYRYGRLQAMILPQFDSTEAFLDALCRAKNIEDCRGNGSQNPTFADSSPSTANIDPDELNNIGREYFSQQNHAEAIKYFRLAASRGNAYAQYNLGIIYDYGHGVAKDQAEAVRWYRKAAVQGNADGQTNLGTSYFNGQGVEKDHATAVYWYRKAAEQGFARAQYNLGVAYANGYGTEKNYAESVKWYQKAAQQGHVRAQETLKSKGLSW